MPTVSTIAQAQACLDALTTLYRLEARGTTPTPLERQALQAFPGFGCLALDLFPHALTGAYKTPTWEALGTAFRQALTPEDYASAARATYTAFYTPRLIMRALCLGLRHCGVPDDATVLEPGCGIGRFMGLAPATMRFLGIEQDHLSARIARQLYPQHEIRLESIQRTRLDPASVDAVIGNVPFSNEKTPYWGRKLSLHELCVAKSVDALRPGGILALVVTHSLLDRQQSHFRETLADRVSFLGAMRLPAETFAAEGTSVIADLVFLQKGIRLHSASRWVWTTPRRIEGVDVPINDYFHDHPEMVLGTWTRQDRLYGAETGYSVVGTGQLPTELAGAIARLPAHVYAVAPVPAALVAPVGLPIPAPALAEGSLFVEGGGLSQIQNGTTVAVCHGDTPITTQGVLGKRVAHLIRLRDQTREVLRVQREGAPVAEREAARTRLQQSYAAFVHAYGPVNRVSVSERADGTVQRRLPNLVTFRDDPDCPLVMALEDYHESSDTATPHAILTQDVVAAQEPMTHVESAAEGLLVVLNTTGRVDVTAMADLYGQPEAVVLGELGDLLYHDPEQRQWETADLYLSGDVKHKLAAAQAAVTTEPAYQRNVDALAAVQPPDVLPGEIAAHLGAPWMPVDVLTTFLVETFQLREWQVTVAHNRAEALWSVTGVWSAENSDAARVTYGTERVNGLGLMQQALNLQVPTVHETVWENGKERRVVNQAETLMAREKQRLLKQQFQTWIFAEPVRTERLVRLYNDLNNRTRLRHVDGAHLDFPGMTPQVTLTPPQKDAVWRIMTTGNTLLGHAVGGGKTFIMLAAGMKMRQVGLVRKPLYVVPNHMLEQWTRMALQLYPEGRFLLASSDDVTKERRKLLAARMVSGVWDGIITTHSAFERIGMSPGFQQQVLTDLIREYEALLVTHQQEYGHSQHNIRKALEKQKSSYESQLTALLKTEKKDDGLYFDDLAIDYIFIDESTAFKNMQTPTKLQRVAGIQTEGSQRAFDLYLKTRYLHTRHPGRGLTFATGTPVTNSMVELYTLQRFLTPDVLEAHGLSHFDAWAATFGEVVDVMEIAPDGQTLRPRQRFAHFVNLPELQMMIRAMADVQTAAQLALPTPALAGGAAQVVACPLSPTQRHLQDSLVRRYEAVRNGQAGRRSGEALLITNDGKKLALDARLLEATAGDWLDSKLHALVERVVAHWQEGQADQTTQLIFCDLGVNPTLWGFSAHAAILDALEAAGMPRAQLARVDSAKSDLAKERLFAQVRQGEVRVLLGTTARMGLGTNVQTRLVALHHLDAPWKPSEIEQREGRLLRQGNLHRDWGRPVHIYRYVTEGSFDAFMWQTLQTKAHFIHQLLSGATTSRQAEDVGAQELSYAQVKAIASGNPALLTLAETEAELRRLALLEKHHKDSAFLARRRVGEFPSECARMETYRDQLRADQATLDGWQGEKPLVLDGHPCTDEEARALLEPRVAPYLDRKGLSQSVALGTYRGLRCGLTVSTWGVPEVWLQGQTTRHLALPRRASVGGAVLSALRDLGRDLPVRIAQAEHHLATLHQQHQNAQRHLVAPFALGGYRQELRGWCQQLQATLEPGGAPSQQGAIVQAIATLRQTQQQAHLPTVVRSDGTQGGLTPAVTTRILEAQAAGD